MVIHHRVRFQLLSLFLHRRLFLSLSRQPLTDSWAHRRFYAAEPISRFCTHSCTYRPCYAIGHPCNYTVDRFRSFQHRCYFAATTSVERRWYRRIDADSDEHWCNPAYACYFSANSNCERHCYVIGHSFNFESRADRLCHTVAHTWHPSHGPYNDADSCTVQRNRRFHSRIVERVTSSTPASNTAASPSAGGGSTPTPSPTPGVVPLSAIASYQPTTAPIAVNHQGQFPSVTISFNLAGSMALSDAVAAIQQMQQRIGMPGTVHGNFTGTAQAFQASLASEPFLILAALVAVYIVLGILYESYIHPITILSTLPSASVGAVLALMIFHTDLSVIGIIGILLLIGIVKKNAILMVDFALEAERAQGMRPRAAIYQACLLRFRPILMTTTAALFGALPLIISTGMGSELRRPLGITIVGGLIFSQALTLYTTPVVYLYFDRLREWWASRKRRTFVAPQSALGVSDAI